MGYSAGAAEQSIDERCECDSGGSTAVIITNQSAGFSRTYQLGHWSKQTKAVKPGPRRKKALGAAGAYFTLCMEP